MAETEIEPKEILKIPCCFHSYKSTIDGERITLDIPETVVKKGLLDGLHKDKLGWYVLMLYKIETPEDMEKAVNSL